MPDNSRKNSDTVHINVLKNMEYMPCYYRMSNVKELEKVNSTGL
jgi:hypothetical protein